jgi:cytochrome P450
VESVDEDEVSTAFGDMMRTTVNFTPLAFLQFVLQNIPGLNWIRFLPTKRRQVILKTHEVLQRASQRIIARKRAEIQSEIDSQGGVSTTLNEKSFFENGSKSKDLLYLMMKANMATNVKNSEKLDDAELLGQMTTLLLAGHETTSTLTTWLLNVLSEPENIAVQEKLREEIEEAFAGRDVLDYDTLMAIPYLDHVTKEILRFRSPVTSTIRTASKDDVIPLSKAYKTRDGKGTFDSLVVTKGMDVIIPVQVINRLESVWGPTAGKFDPTRWAKLPPAAKTNGMPQHHLSFLSGPRGCVGREFAIAEFKALVCSIIRVLKFERIEGWVVEPKQGIVIRPRIIGQEDLGMQMPLRISRVS